MQGFAAQQPEHDPRAVDDHTLVPAGHPHTPRNLANPVTEVTDRNFAPDEIPSLGRVSAFPLPRQAVGEPIRLAGNVIKDLREA